jgi:uroporphyrinogen decarboxylase
MIGLTIFGKDVRMGNMNKREWVLKALKGEKTDRIPVGFWFHYAPDELVDGFVSPEIFEQNIAGHQKYFKEFQPDFMKIMTDGFFIYPNREFRDVEKAADLWKVKSIGADHPWIEKQAAFAKNIAGAYGKEILTFYNIFSAATIFRFVRQANEAFMAKKKSPETLLADFILEDPDAVLHALDVAAGDLAILARRVIATSGAEGGADGIYFSVQDLCDSRIDGALHRKVIAPSDKKVLEGANAVPSLNILHICGYAGHRNDLRHFADYPAQVINWAAVCEGIPLGEGKKIFGNKPVIGGFDNTVQGVLYRGTEEEIKAETRRILAESGRTGVILGADCTIPRGIDLQHLQWVREAAAE